jgi:hypothetical protein
MREARIALSKKTGQNLPEIPSNAFLDAFKQTR